MNKLSLLVVAAACASRRQTFAPASLTVDGVPVATAATLVPLELASDTLPPPLSPTPPPIYVGWSIAYAEVAPGTPCGAPQSAALAQLIVDRNGSAAEIALPTGDFAVATRGTPRAGVSVFTPIVADASSGTVTIGSFDGDRVDGRLDGIAADGAHITGTFTAYRCDDWRAVDGILPRDL